jgi:hypothetical protein
MLGIDGMTVPHTFTRQESPMSAIVMCRVSGGVTGTREAPLKDRNGEVRRFATMAEAQAEARRLIEKQRAERYQTAYFQYWAEEMR